MAKQKRKVRALAMFSGGLDSILAIKMIQEQGIEVEALNFTSVFFPNEKVVDTARKLGVKLRVIDITGNKSYIKLLKKPKYGYGVGINPCIDCKIFMLKEAKKIMLKEKFDFIITGEVLNERPMSQTYDKLMLIEKESGLKDKLLRPLSARLLPPIKAEMRGLVNRQELLSINGRSRKEQMGLALRYGITEYPSPAGGCILCEKPIKDKLRDLFENKKIEEINYNELALLKIGRHFRIEKTKFIVGRNKEENEKISLLKKPKDFLFEVPDCGSPFTLLQSIKPHKKEIEIAAKLTAYYSDSKEKNVVINYWNDLNEKKKDKISIKFDEKEITEILKNKIG